jgi:hypothetical protein
MNYAPYNSPPNIDIPPPIKKTNFCPFEPFGPMYKVHGNFPTYSPVYSPKYDFETSYNEYHKPMNTTPVAYNQPPADEPDAPLIQTPAVANPYERAQALAKLVYGKKEKKKVPEPEPLWSDDGLLTFILFLVCIYVIIVIASSKKF